jgi:polypeptide N-acetylgalactosaminyltransferase
VTENLKKNLEDYINLHFHGKVKLYRNSERLGLIGTRTNGARYSTGDVIVFLDAHCECGPNWLPPLLSRIAYDRFVNLFSSRIQSSFVTES